MAKRSLLFLMLLTLGIAQTPISLFANGSSQRLLTVLGGAITIIGSIPTIGAAAWFLSSYKPNLEKHQISDKRSNSIKALKPSLCLTTAGLVLIGISYHNQLSTLLHHYLPGPHE